MEHRALIPGDSLVLEGPLWEMYEEEEGEESLGVRVPSAQQ